MTRKELEDLAKNTRDPRTLSPEILAQMKAAGVGPFAHDWQPLIDALQDDTQADYDAAKDGREWTKT